MEERRKYRRATVAMHATVLSDGTSLGTFNILNLSASGALLRGSVPLIVGQPISVLLELSARTLLRASAVVVRKTAGRPPQFAISFDRFLNGNREVVHAAVMQVLAGAAVRRPR
jgi:hypothetical protein